MKGTKGLSIDIVHVRDAKEYSLGLKIVTCFQIVIISEVLNFIIS